MHVGIGTEMAVAAYAMAVPATAVRGMPAHAMVVHVIHVTTPTAEIEVAADKTAITDGIRSSVTADSSSNAIVRARLRAPPHKGVTRKAAGRSSRISVVTSLSVTNLSENSRWCRRPPLSSVSNPRKPRLSQQRARLDKAERNARRVVAVVEVAVVAAAVVRDHVTTMGRTPAASRVRSPMRARMSQAAASRRMSPTLERQSKALTRRRARSATSHTARSHRVRTLSVLRLVDRMRLPAPTTIRASRGSHKPLVTHSRTPNRPRLGSPVNLGVRMRPAESATLARLRS